MSGDVERPAVLDTSHLTSVQHEASPVGSPGGSGSPAFDRLRVEMIANPALVREVENALQVLVDRVNPSDRGARFVVGTAVEWIVASAAWSAGVLATPGGHSVDGFDLQDLEDRVRGLWSVKSSFQQQMGSFRISNGLGGAGRGMTDPTVFLHPRLPGATLVDPGIHADVVDQIVQRADGTDVLVRVVRDHAARRPECVIPLAMAANEQRGKEDAALLFTKGLLTADRFPRLHQVFVAAEPRQASVADELMALAAMRARGELSGEEFDTAKARVLGRG